MTRSQLRKHTLTFSSYLKRLSDVIQTPPTIKGVSLVSKTVGAIYLSVQGQGVLVCRDARLWGLTFGTFQGLKDENFKKCLRITHPHFGSLGDFPYYILFSFQDVFVNSKIS